MIGLLRIAETHGVFAAYFNDAENDGLAQMRPVTNGAMSSAKLHLN
ncbi:MAG: hypothetical protein ACRYG4_05625 [Janthinobacterium lividum]